MSSPTWRTGGKPEQDDRFSHFARPASIHRNFKNRRKYPPLPRGYDWKTQKERYCPHNLLVKRGPEPLELKHKFGYVFCHRGLYERASYIPENSAAAITNGVREGLFLHEIDTFVLEKLDHLFVAHDKNASRVTKMKKDWANYQYAKILKQSNVSRMVATTGDFVAPETLHSESSLSPKGVGKASPTSVIQNKADFASSYLQMPGRI